MDALKLIGRFAEFEVTVQGSQLMFRDTNQRNINYKKMTAITSTLFQVGNDYQVVFESKNGLFYAIKIYWDDGYEDKISKSDK